MASESIRESGRAVVVMVDMPDMTAELYEATCREQGLKRGLPEGYLRVT